jgi:type IV secretory pathway VirB10-like protein
MEEFKKIFHTELALLKSQLATHQNQALANQTPTANVEAKLDLIMQHLQLTTTQATAKTPSPPRKRRDQSSTPQNFRTQSQSMAEDEEEDYPYPETTLHWDSDEHENESSSSRDGEKTPSGSDHSTSDHPANDNAWMGSTFSSTKEANTFRVLFQNVNSFGTTQYQHNILEFANSQDTLQVDFAGITEHCLNISQPRVLNSIQQSLNKFYRGQYAIQFNSADSRRYQLTSPEALRPSLSEITHLESNRKEEEATTSADGASSHYDGNFYHH